jgi:hypothetical protein
MNEKENQTPAEIFKRTADAFKEASNRVSTYSVEERARLSDAARLERAGSHGSRREVRSH